MTTLHPHDDAPGTTPDLAWRADGFLSLGETFATPTMPRALEQPHWVAANRPLADALGWSDWLFGARKGAPAAAAAAWPRDEWLPALAGNAVLAGSRPAATVYSGHQFGVWAGRLGDGRALLLGELDSRQGPMELQLKGSGRTLYSRMGDGRAVLRSSVREYLCSEAMHGLGIATTRALTLVGASTPVYREEQETAAVVCRVAPSFVRFGHFEHFAANGQTESLRVLADFVVARYGERLAQQTGIAASGADGEAARYLALLAQVSDATARLLAQWQAVGFVHGVMNTDNMSVLGLTLDYGPFQFIDGFEPRRITNHSDHEGRYVLARQPSIGYWNLLALAQALAPLIGDDERTAAAVGGYRESFPRYFAAAMARKLGGRADVPEAQVDALLAPLLRQLARERTDYPIFWRCLSHAAASGDFTPVRDLMVDRDEFDAWLLEYRRWLDAHADADTIAQMLRTNPKYVLRNHLAEQAIEQAKAGDFDTLARLTAVLQNPFDEWPEQAGWADFPPAWAAGIQVSCSS